MDSLKDIYAAMNPNGGINLPDDGVCPVCGRLVRNHSGVESLLAVRGLKYFDPDRGQVVVKAGIPYCNCP